MTGAVLQLREEQLSLLGPLRRRLRSIDAEPSGPDEFERLLEDHEELDRLVARSQCLPAPARRHLVAQLRRYQDLTATKVAELVIAHVEMA